MTRTRPRSPVRFSILTRALALILASAHALVVTLAPLADRADTSVAPIHAEQAGTSTHHAHGELCAVCVASQLVAPPARASLAPIAAQVRTQPHGERRQLFTAADRLHSQPRAPPA